MYAPTGIGVLWGKTEHLTAMPPYQGGGEMIAQVSFEHTEYAPLPNKFEAGTPDIAGVIGLGAAIDYLQTLTMSEIAAYEMILLAYAKDAMAELQQFRVIGQAAHKVPIISFVHAHVHAHDVGTILDSQGVAVRSGHHCAMPLMAFYDVAATTRMSLSFYNTIADIDRFIAALHMVEQVFA